MHRDISQVTNIERGLTDSLNSVDIGSSAYQSGTEFAGALEVYAQQRINPTNISTAGKKFRQ